MNRISLLVALFAAGCAASSFRDQVSQDVRDTREQLSAVETRLLSVSDQVSAVKSEITDELRTEFAGRFRAADQRLRDLEAAIAAGETRLKELKEATLELSAKKAELSRMALEVKETYDQLKSKQGMNLEFGWVKARGFTVQDKAGRTLVEAMSGVDGDGYLSIWNRSGEQVVMVATDKEGDGGILLSNKDGGHVLRAGAAPTGGRIWLNDNQGETAVYAGAHEKGGYFAVVNKVKREVIQAYTDDHGDGYFGVFNRDGKGRVMLPR